MLQQVCNNGFFVSVTGIVDFYGKRAWLRQFLLADKAMKLI
ncbi:hypothetical protein ABID47_000709 [Paenibacillus favisporus]|uniref:Uncharacterized protein n=1 Tax=Paenibacillus favisporus TaxID=221028 RepID=A0ABV2EWZ5_9BACL|nr:hypothetical protein [Paenibacillus cellulositrophicus]